MTVIIKVVWHSPDLPDRDNSLVATVGLGIALRNTRIHSRSFELTLRLLQNIIMHNMFSNFLYLASLFAHLSSILNNFNCDDEN